MDDELARDLAAMWRSEFAAMTVDRELRETWAALLQPWTAAALAMTTARDLPSDTPPGSAVATQPPGPASAPAASEPGLAEIDRLRRRVVELEQCLAGLQPGRGGA